MSSQGSQHSALLGQLVEHLTAASYSTVAISRQSAVAGYFLHYLEQRHLAIESVQPKDVEMYLRCELRRFVRRHGRAPRSIKHWRGSHTSGVHQLLRMVNGQWPPPPAASTPFGAFSQNLCLEFAQWLAEQRGLAQQGIDDLAAEARRFLAWYGERAAPCDLQALTSTDLDAYLQVRAASLKRVSRKSLVQRLRCFLRFVHATERTPLDFANCVKAPTLYAFESIPSALSMPQIDAVIRTCREDSSAIGLRDHAIVLLLATYGLRAGEVVRLRLDDIDWRNDRLYVRHSKTGEHSVLPLLPEVGSALLAYLRRGRPTTASREVFIRGRAPYRGFVEGSSLYTPINRRLDAAGVKTSGKHGPHAFRHARAVSLLRSGVPPKVIGDVLGHRSASSVKAYLKLASDELRDVVLEIGELTGEDVQ
jgi:site-specific recombinase XerD